LSRALLVAVMTLAWTGAAQADAVQEALRARIENLPGNGIVPVVASFYGQRDFRPGWTRREQARALVAVVETLPGHGLDTADYPLETLHLAAADTGGSPAQRADRDLLLTATLARLSAQLSHGKVDPRRLYPEWNFAATPALGEQVSILESLLQQEDLGRAVAALAPQQPEYQGLRAALAHYRRLEQAGGWGAVGEGPTLKPGMRDSRVTALRGRLQAEGEALAAGPDAQRFDPALQAAVIRFQARHGMDPDGTVGRRTLAELNVPVAARIAQIRVNLERLRWVARDRVGDHLLVDIAGFTARLYLDGHLAWDSKVVVGRPYRKTPAFRADLQYLVLNPRWVVPPTILREDVLPKAAADPGYLAAHDMRMVDEAGQVVAPEAVDWGRARAGRFPYRIVQVPGPDNPLGQIKFMLPNPYSIYLHDTPSRRLFKRSMRAESSGCVRLEKPQELAVLLLDDPERWSPEALQAELATGHTRSVSVKRQVPVLVLYFTAEAEAGGAVQLRPDLYGRDEAVLAALNRPAEF
jgi:murein L,D-transpeptidase YcbB/YkuD